jgi:hypothetical protein
MDMEVREPSLQNFFIERKQHPFDKNTSCSQDMLPIHTNILHRLDYFLQTNKIPHIIFHGPSGSGKRTIVYDFLNKIYKNDKHKIKTNVMFVNCAHGKGIKFIREELKFFAKTNIQSNLGVSFKTIILMNADFLTIDAQSALRRCIELFSYNTRFFIIVENKHKLLNPILSRFCEIYVPEHTIDGKVINLHQYNLNRQMDFSEYDQEKKNHIRKTLLPLPRTINHALFSDIVTDFYENGISCLDLMHFVEECGEWNREQTTYFQMEFYNIKSEYRCEKLLMFYMLDYMYRHRSDPMS